MVEAVEERGVAFNVTDSVEGMQLCFRTGRNTHVLAPCDLAAKINIAQLAAGGAAQARRHLSGT